MSTYDKRRVFRVYTYDKSYVLTSQLIESERLQIKLVDSSVCLNKLSLDEWSMMTQSRTNSVRSPSVALVFDSYGCLGLLSVSMQQIQQIQQYNQQQQQQQNSTSLNNNNNSNSQSSSFYTKNNYNLNDAANANMQHYLLFVKEASSVGQLGKVDILKITDLYVLPLTNTDYNNQSMTQANTNQNNSTSGYINDIRKFLSSGVFYFAYSSDLTSKFDLTLSSQARNLGHHTNKKFLWNFNLHLPFRRLNVDTDQWLLKIICGCVEIKKIITLTSSYKACIFSRLSCERVGTRFNCRGCNDDGNVANFVETEQVVYSTDTNEETSFIQIRGSAPVFFEQSGIQVGSHKIKLSRSSHACYPSFERHMKSLMQDYGSKVFVLNLLGVKGDEPLLTSFFHFLCQISPFSMSEQLKYTNFDYHQELKLNKQALGEKMWPHLIKEFYKDNHSSGSTDGMFFSLRSNNNNYNQNSENGNNNINFQTKFIRTNCMDCLDRTNSVQSFIGIEMLTYQLKDFVSQSDLNKFREVFRQMWIINGDYISKIYAGTGAIQGKSVTQDISRSLSRAIQNNFLDSNKQDAIETFLFSMSRNYGELAERVRVLMSPTFLRLPYSILREVVINKSQYIEQVKCKVAIGTWNINGGFNQTDMEQVNLNEWLIDGPFNKMGNHSSFGYLDPNTPQSNFGDIDIFAIGFEEMVDLNAQNIVSASDENANKWFLKINECLKNQGDYVQLVYENLQLVGVCLFVFVLRKHVPYIRDICISKTKTGFGGTAGNKGGVLLRFIYYNTSMCFVCSHFAAHQKQIKERNDDFRQIYEQSEFVGQAVTSASKIEVKNHDYIFWFGDLNYRIDMPNDRCRSLIAERDWKTLLELDQLSVQRAEGNVFREFIEAPIAFPPTYKYNVFEDTYDRSEKCRVPAWTDRILWRRRITRQDSQNPNFNPGKCLYYNRADIRNSDHRPVSALIEVDVSRVIPKKLIEVLNSVFQSSHGSFQITLIVSNDKNMMDDKIKNSIIKLFNQFTSYAMAREYRNQVYVTFTDAKYGYEAYAQLNNYYMQNYDITLQVRVENEQNYQKLIEQELMDCLISLNCVNDNIRKDSISAITPEHEVHVADLLGEDFKYGEENDDFKSYINLPAQLHTNLSITNNMHQMRSKNLDTSPSHLYHNPLVKALSNSNLTMFNNNNNNQLQINKPNTNHSVVDLLGLNNENNNETNNSNNSHNNNTINKSSSGNLIPRRPPPPIPLYKQTTQANTFRDIFGNADVMLAGSTSTDQSPIQEEQLVQISSPPLINIESASSFANSTTNSTSNNLFGFDDNFTATKNIANDLAEAFNGYALQPTQSNSSMTAVPPRPPPIPSNNSNTNSTNAIFTLFDDNFEPVTQTVQNSAPAVVPPPLPPLPANLMQKTTNDSISYSLPPPLPPMPPQRPPQPNALPPPLPPMPSSTKSNSNNKSNPFDDLNPFGNIQNKQQPPVPPPRPSSLNQK